MPLSVGLWLSQLWQKALFWSEHTLNTLLHWLSHWFKRTATLFSCGGALCFEVWVQFRIHWCYCFLAENLHFVYSGIWGILSWTNWKRAWGVKKKATQELGHFGIFENSAMCRRTMLLEESSQWLLFICQIPLSANRVAWVQGKEKEAKSGSTWCHNWCHTWCHTFCHKVPLATLGHNLQFDHPRTLKHHYGSHTHLSRRSDNSKGKKENDSVTGRFSH